MIKNTARTSNFPTPEYLPFSDEIPPDAEYCYIGRIYKAARNVDAVMWWKDDAGCHCRCVLTGDRMEPASGQEVANRAIECSELTELLNKLVSAGALEVPSQPDTLVISHSDRLASIKLADGRENTYAIRGGVPQDPRAKAIGAIIFDAAPEFFPGIRRKS